MNRLAISLIIIAFLASSCAQSQSIFPEPGQNLATPSSMAVDVATGRLYVVNSNSKVLYDWQRGSFQVYDIADPLAPALMLTTDTSSFSGQIYLDQATSRAYVPNRFSESEATVEDRLYIFNVDEASANFGSVTEEPAGRDAYAIDCCYPANRAWVTTSLGELQYFDLANIGKPNSISLETQLDTGGSLTHAEVNHITRMDPLAYLSREYGGILIVNLDDAGVAGSVAVDYWISDIPNPRGIANDGTDIWIVGEGNECDTQWCRFVMVLDVSILTPLSDNSFTYQVDKEDAGLLLARIEVGKNPQEILLTTEYAFVTNQDDDTVSVISRLSNQVVATIEVGDEPFSLALYTTPAGEEKYLYVGNVESNTISIIDIPTLSVVATYP